MFDRIVIAVENLASRNLFVRKCLIRYELLECSMRMREADRLDAYLKAQGVSEKAIQEITQGIRKDIAEYRAQLIDCWNSTCKPKCNPQKPKELNHESSTHCLEVNH